MSKKIIEDKLKETEYKIKNNNKLNRTDIEKAINLIINDVSSLDELKEHLGDFIKRSGVREIGFKTYYSPRNDLVEEDRTLSFLDDIFSFRSVRERFLNAEIQRSEKNRAIR